MASRSRVPFSERAPRTQKYVLKAGRDKGYSQEETIRRYNNGTLGSLAAVRYHKNTPEHPERAARNPQRYPKYRRTGIGGKAMKVLAKQGATSAVVVVDHLSKAEQKLVGQHWWTAEMFLKGRRDERWFMDRMAGFENKTVGENRVRFETRIDGLEALAFETELDFENIYPETGMGLSA